MSISKAMRKNKHAFKRCFAILLLAFYIIGNTQIEAIHGFFHSHGSSITHSSEQENDPCHRTIYHDDKSYGCEHRSHLTRVEKCVLCHIIVSNDTVVVSDSSCDFIKPSSRVIENEIAALGTYIAIHLPPRAPPIL
jgi:hypothetical protein